MVGRDNNPATNKLFPKNAGIVLANGIKMYYEIHGEKNSNAPLLILIGGLSRDHTIWNNLLDNLSADFRVMVYDNRGTGQTDYLANSPYTIELLAEDLAALLDTLKITESAYIIGHSMGGFTAQYLAAKYPDKVRGLMLCNTCMKQPAAAKQYLTERLIAIDNGVPAETMFRSVLPWLFSKDFVTEDKIQTMLETVQQNPYPQSLTSLRAQINACLVHDSSIIIDKIKAPTMIVTGANELIITPEVCKEMQERIRKSKVEILADTAHMIQLEQPDATCATIKGFVMIVEQQRTPKSHL